MESKPVKKEDAKKNNFEWADEVVVDGVKHCADDYYDSIVYNWFDEQ